MKSPPNAEERRQSLRYLVTEGSYASVMGTVTSGAFLTGLAMSLGAEEFEIGILASLPIIANFVNIPASYIVERTGLQRTVCLRSLFLSRSMWFIILLLPFLLQLQFSRSIIVIFLGLVSCHYILEAVAGLAWFSWISELVPKEGMGKYFSRRNAINSGIGLLTGIVAGQLLDSLQALFPSNAAFSFSILILFGLVGGMISLSYLSRMADVPTQRLRPHESFLKLLKLPLKQQGFTHFLLFRVAWDFSVNLAAPFFSVYMIRDAALSYSFIGALGAITGLASLVSVRYWGILSDRIGNKSVLRLSAIVKAIFPLLWLFTTPDSYPMFVLIHLTGVFDAGLNLTVSNLLMKLAPKEKRSVYFALHFTVARLVASLAPITGAFVAQSLAGNTLSLGFLTIGHLKFLFLASGILRMLSLLFLSRVVEPPLNRAEFEGSIGIRSIHGETQLAIRLRRFAASIRGEGHGNPKSSGPGR